MRASVCHIASTNRRVKERLRKDSLDGVRVDYHRERSAAMTSGRGGNRGMRAGLESSDPVASPYSRRRSLHSAASTMEKMAIGLSPVRSAGSSGRAKNQASPAL